MDKEAKKPTREERLAAKLRENLHRRKAQARASSDSEGRIPPSRKREEPGEGLPEGNG
ncbi:MAG: hypothetical protein R3E09_02050 [Novosphingobium sp.]